MLKQLCAEHCCHINCGIIVYLLSAVWVSYGPTPIIATEGLFITQKQLDYHPSYLHFSSSKASQRKSSCYPITLLSFVPWQSLVGNMRDGCSPYMLVRTITQWLTNSTILIHIHQSHHHNQTDTGRRVKGVVSGGAARAQTSHVSSLYDWLSLYSTELYSTHCGACTVAMNHDVVLSDLYTSQFRGKREIKREEDRDRR